MEASVMAIGVHQLPGVGAVLDAAVGVVDPPRRGPLALNGQVERVQGDLGVQGLAHRPAGDLAGGHVDDGRKLEPTFASGDVGLLDHGGLPSGFQETAEVRPLAHVRDARLYRLGQPLAMTGRDIKPDATWRRSLRA
jgi:hypothetical protein